MATERISSRDTGDPAFSLLAGIIRQAVLDMRRGDRSAAQWLWEYAPAAARVAVDLMEKSEKRSLINGVQTSRK